MYIIVALQHTHNTTSAAARGRQAYIITDSQFAVGCLLKGWQHKSTLLASLCEAITGMISKSLLKWHINWVPGHAGVDGNTIADAAANRGADQSKRREAATSRTWPAPLLTQTLLTYTFNFFRLRLGPSALIYSLFSLSPLRGQYIFWVFILFARLALL